MVEPWDFGMGMLAGALVANVILATGFYCFSTGQLRRILRCLRCDKSTRKRMSTLVSPRALSKSVTGTSVAERIASFHKQASRLTKKKRKLLLELSDAEPLAPLGSPEMPALESGCTGEFWNTKYGRLALHTCAELYTTELQFAQDLLSALRLFREPLAPTLSSKERFAVFSNMKELAGLSSELLRDLQKEGDPIEVVANAFAHVAPFFMLYGTFLSLIHI